MKRTLLIAIGTALAVGSKAQLAPSRTAPLSAHLVEVNAQWRTIDPASLTERPVHFATEADRIALHLRMVCDRLDARVPASLSNEQRASRSFLVGRLRVYADGRRFPQNNVLPYRNPVFIDTHNTACAVGQLMRESGNAMLAQRVHDETNLAYVPDIGIPEVASWGTEHGFTTDELAWIQPGYPPTDPWTSLGGGTDASVTTLLKLTNGDLLVAGAFTLAGGASRQHVARWDGSVYQQLGNGVDGTVECAIEQAGIIMLGGSFQNGGNDVAIWNGSTWTYSNVFPGMSPAVHALHIHNNELYAAGTASGFSGTDNRVSKLVGMAWQFVGDNMNNSIHALASFNGELVMGGAFTGLWSFGNPDSSVQHVARLNGNSWVQLADGLNAAVHDLEVFNGQLHAGGELFANIAPMFGLARIAPGGSAWEQLMPNLSMYIFPGVGPTNISSLCAADSALYIGGAFDIISGLTMGANIAVFHGQVDQFTPTATLNAPVLDIALHANRVVIGGDFVSGNGVQLDHIGWLDLSTGLQPPHEQLTMALWPNPTNDRTTVSVGDALSPNAFLELTDATGRVVQSERMSSAQHWIDVSALASGAYTVRVSDGDRSGTMGLLKP